MQSKDSDSDTDDQVGLTVSHALSVDAGLQNKWIIDSGATCHMCSDRSQFNEFNILKQTQEVVLGDGNSLKAVGRGTVTLELSVSHGKKSCILKDVLYVPNLTYNLLSVAKSTEVSDKAVFGKSKCEFLKGGKVVATGKRLGELYYLECENGKQVAAVALSDIYP